MSQTVLLNSLASVRRRVRLLSVVHGFGLLLAAAVALLLATIFLDYLLNLPPVPRVVVLLAAIFGVGYVASRYLLRPMMAKLRLTDVAGRIEQTFPAFDDRLRSVVDFAGKPSDESAAMKQRVIAQASDLAQHIDLAAVIRPRPAIGALGGGLAAIVFCMVLAMAAGPEYLSVAMGRLLTPFAAHAWPKRTQISVLGSLPARVPAGTPVEVRIKLVKGDKPSAKAIIYYQYDKNGPVEQEMMSRNSDGTYTANIDATIEPGKAAGMMSMWMKSGDDSKDLPNVQVVPPLMLKQIEAVITPPKYASLPPVTLDLAATPASVTAGSGVDLRVEFSHALAPGDSVHVVPAASDAVAPDIQWQPVAPGAMRAIGHFTAQKQVRFKVLGTDPDGFTNTGIEEFQVLVHPDQLPTVQFEKPVRNEEALAVATIPIAAVAEDDFGIKSMDLMVRRLGDNKAWTLPMIQSAKPSSDAVQWTKIDSTGDRLRYRMNWDWDLAQLDGAALKAGDQLEFYLRVQDNYEDDQGKPHTPPYSESGRLHVTIISLEQLTEQISDQLAQLREQVDDTRRQNEGLRAGVKSLQQDTQNKPTLDKADRAMANQLATDQSAAAGQTKQIAGKLSELLARIQQNSSANTDSAQALRELAANAAEAQRLLNSAAENPMKDAASKLSQLAGQPNSPNPDNTSPNNNSPNNNSSNPGRENQPTSGNQNPQANQQNSPSPSANGDNNPNNQQANNQQPRDQSATGNQQQGTQQQGTQQQQRNQQQQGNQQQSPNANAQNNGQQRQNQSGQQQSGQQQSGQQQSGQQQTGQQQSGQQQSGQQQSGQQRSGQQQSGQQQSGQQQSGQQQSGQQQSGQQQSGQQQSGQQQSGQQQQSAQQQQTPQAAARDATLQQTQQQQAAASEQLQQAMDKMGADSGLSRFLKQVSNLLDQQRKLSAQTAQTGKDLLGKDASQLTDEEKKQIQDLAQQQQDLAKQADQAMQQMNDSSQKQARTDPSSSQALQQAAKTGQQQNVSGNMNQAGQAEQQNQQANAQSAQRQAELGLMMMVRQLKEAENRRLLELMKQLDTAQQLVADLLSQQAGHNLDNLMLQGGSVLSDATKTDPELVKDLIDYSNRDATNLGSPAPIETQIALQAQTERNTRNIVAVVQALPEGADPAADLTRAAQRMSRAVSYLQDSQLVQAYQPPQVDALAALISAKTSLDKQNEQARQQQQNQQKETLRQQFVDIRAEQAKINDQTKAIDATPRTADGQLGHQARANIGLLSDQQANLAKRTAKLDDDLAAVGSIAYTYANDDITARMTKVAGSLGKLDPGPTTQQPETRIVRELDDMIKNLAIRARQSQFSNPRTPQQQNPRQPGQGQGGQPPPPKLPAEAEVRLIQDMQKMLNEDTKDADAVAVKDKAAVLDLGKRQGDLRKMLDDILQKSSDGKITLGPEPLNKQTLPEEAKDEDLDLQELKDTALNAKPDDQGIADDTSMLGIRMARARQRLALDADPGVTTQKIQERIIIEMDGLANMAQQQQAQAQRASRQRQPGQPRQGQPQPGQQPGNPNNDAQARNQPNQPQQNRNNRGGGNTNGLTDTNTDASVDQLKEAWGKLSPRQRSAVLEGSTDQTILKFKDFVDAYYRTLAAKAVEQQQPQP